MKSGSFSRIKTGKEPGWMILNHNVLAIAYGFVQPGSTPPESDAVNLMLDPGLAFGTGTHPTTSLCLTWLDQQNLKKNQSLITAVAPAYFL